MTTAWLLVIVAALPRVGSLVCAPLVPRATAVRVATPASCAPSGIRVNKVFTSAFSRRETDRLVAAGRVSINGVTATPGDRVLPGDRVTLDGRAFAAASAFAAAAADGGDGIAPFFYIKYWKPRGVTCTTDRSVRGNLLDALAAARLNDRSRAFPVGRLDKDSDGLLLLTNDGRVPNAIGRAAHAHEKLYLVHCSRRLDDADLRRLSEGVVITTVAQRDRGPPKPLTAATLPCEVRRARGDGRSFRITLTEGRNRQIRRMCEAAGHEVVALHRERIMGITLQGLRGPGDWCELNAAETQAVLGAVDAAEPSARAEAGARRGRPQSDRRRRTSRP